jgi:hypothetical protein
MTPKASIAAWRGPCSSTVISQMTRIWPPLLLKSKSRGPCRLKRARSGLSLTKNAICGRENTLPVDKDLNHGLCHERADYLAVDTLAFQFGQMDNRVIEIAFNDDGAFTGHHVRKVHSPIGREGLALKPTSRS